MFVLLSQHSRERERKRGETERERDIEIGGIEREKEGGEKERERKRQREANQKIIMKSFANEFFTVSLLSESKYLERETPVRSGVTVSLFMSSTWKM